MYKEFTQIFDCSQARSELCKVHIRQAGGHENNNPELDSGVPTRVSKIHDLFLEWDKNGLIINIRTEG